MPTDRLAELVGRLEPVAKIGGFLKWLICAVAIGTAWLVTLQLETTSNTNAIAEIRTDRKERIRFADAWRAQKDKEDTARQTILEIAVQTQKHQQEQIETLQKVRP